MEKLIMWLKLYNIKRLRLATEMSISVNVRPSVRRRNEWYFESATPVTVLFRSSF